MGYQKLTILKIGRSKLHLTRYPT